LKKVLVTLLGLFRATAAIRRRGNSAPLVLPSLRPWWQLSQKSTVNIFSNCIIMLGCCARDDLSIFIYATPEAAHRKSKYKNTSSRQVATVKKMWERCSHAIPPHYTPVAEYTGTSV